MGDRLCTRDGVAENPRATKPLSNGTFPFQTAPPDNLFKSGYPSLETLATQRQLAWVLSGDCRPPPRIDSGIPTRFNPSVFHFRSPDAIFDGGYSELKYPGDRVNRDEARMDAYLQGKGYIVRYDVVPHPLTGKFTPFGDLRWLKFMG